MKTEMTEIFNGIYKITMGNPEKLTPMSLFNVVPQADKLAGFSPRECRFAESDIASVINAKGTVIKLSLNDDENIYGFGLQLKSFNHRRRKVQIRCNADPLSPSGDSHAPAPFYLSSAGYGILVDTARYASFYCGSSENKYGGNDMVIEIPVAQGADIYVIEGATMMEVVRKYVMFSGGGAKLPDWSLGVWYRMHSKATAEEAISTLENELLGEDIPCDVLGLEPGWHTQAYSCSYKIDPVRMAKWNELLANLKEKNIRLNLWEHAYVHPSADIHDDIAPYSGDYRVWRGLVPDFATAEGRRIFAEHHKKTLVNQGVSGFKLDECDGSDYTGGWGFPNVASFPSGLDGEQMHNVLGVLYQQTILDAFNGKEGEDATCGLVRASHLFAAPLPFVLYSDLYDQADYLRGLVNAGFSGMLWTPELRTAASPEDMIRRIQMLVFSALTHIDCWFIKNPPWFNVNRNENNSDIRMPESEQVKKLARYWLQLRKKLFPYVRAAFDKYVSDGTPPLRAMVMDFENDPDVANISDQYMMGDCLLVAPLIAKPNRQTEYLPEQYGTTESVSLLADVDRRKVYLPAGKWKHMFTGELFEPGWHDSICSLEQMPVYVNTSSDSTMLELLPTYNLQLKSD